MDVESGVGAEEHIYVRDSRRLAYSFLVVAAAGVGSYFLLISGFFTDSEANNGLVFISGYTIFFSIVFYIKRSHKIYISDRGIFFRGLNKLGWRDFEWKDLSFIEEVTPTFVKNRYLLRMKSGADISLNLSRSEYWVPVSGSESIVECFERLLPEGVKARTAMFSPAPLSARYSGVLLLTIFMLLASIFFSISGDAVYLSFSGRAAVFLWIFIAILIATIGFLWREPSKATSMFFALLLALSSTFMVWVAGKTISREFSEAESIRFQIFGDAGNMQRWESLGVGKRLVLEVPAYPEERRYKLGDEKTFAIHQGYGLFPTLSAKQYVGLLVRDKMPEAPVSHSTGK
ncbi:MAG: hypothetical protein Q8J78_08820 [Moraxellaceae bacterium]|nr:hypothetical protein [Moraxellaceae bacterium]